VEKPCFARSGKTRIGDQAWRRAGARARHPDVGAVRIHTLQLSVPRASQIVVAVAPADEASAVRFDRLREIGSDSRKGVWQSGGKGGRVFGRTAVVDLERRAVI